MGPTAPVMKTLALVESPAQLLNVVEWAHHPAVLAGDLTAVVLAPGNEMSRLQLRAMSTVARHSGIDVVWHEPRQGGAATARTVRALAGELSGTDRLVIGDPFSGVMQVMISIGRPAAVVVVDDGTATLEFARQWLSGEHLTRWHQVATPDHRRQVARFARDQIAGSVRRRLSPESGCSLTVFSCLPVHLPTVRVLPNRYEWLRRRHPSPPTKPAADLVGTSLVETGVVDRGAYLSAVARLAARHSVDRYFAHRKEAADKLAEIARLGLQVVRPELPLELAIRTGRVGSTVLSFPSTVVHTLPVVLRDTAARVVVCDIDADWLRPDAPVRSGPFLDSVNSTARDQFGLQAVAC